MSLDCFQQLLSNESDALACLCAEISARGQTESFDQAIQPGRLFLQPFGFRFVAIDECSVLLGYLVQACDRCVDLCDRFALFVGSNR